MKIFSFCILFLLPYFLCALAPQRMFPFIPLSSD